MKFSQMTQSEIEDLKKQFHHGSDIETILNALKAELALKSDNTHVGSGLGGDVSLLYAIMSREVKTSISYLIVSPKVSDITDTSLSISLPGSWFDIVLEGSEEHYEFQHIFHGKILVKKECLASMRAAFNEHRKDFVTEIVVQNTVLSPSWLKEQRQTTDISLLTSCLHVCYDVLPDLRTKNEILDKVDNAFFFEEDVVRQDFLSEMRLPKTAFAFAEGSALKSKMHSMIEKHPVYGRRLKKIRDRKLSITSLLLEGLARQALLTINSFPEYIKVLCVRNLIGLDMMVLMNLDSYITIRELD